MSKNIDIDELSVELSRELALENIEKALPPKLLYRFRKWMRSHASRGMPARFPQLVTQKFEEISHAASLKKNEAAASFYDNGIVKMDFGSEVSPKVKEAAMKWAKRRGLVAVEASLNKSAGQPQTFMFAKDTDFPEFGQCVKRMRWST